MRAFIGLPVPDLWGPALEAVQAAMGDGRPVATDALHVTLAFLGEISPDVAEEVHEALDARRLIRCMLMAEGLELFGGRSPRLLALAIRPTPDLVALQAAVCRAVSSVGHRLERRRFRPHATLVRFGAGFPPAALARTQQTIRDLGPPALEPAPVHVAHFYQSHLGPGGARYESLAEYALV